MNVDKPFVAGEFRSYVSEHREMTEETSDHIDVHKQLRQQFLQILELDVVDVVPTAGHHQPECVEDVDAEDVTHRHDGTFVVAVVQMFAKDVHKFGSLLFNEPAHVATSVAELTQMAQGEATLLLPEVLVGK